MIIVCTSTRFRLCVKMSEQITVQLIWLFPTHYRSIPEQVQWAGFAGSIKRKMKRHPGGYDSGTDTTNVLVVSHQGLRD